MKGYEFHPEAEIDLDTIWEFIAEDSQLAADRMIDAIEATIEALVPLPHQGHRRPDLTSRPLRGQIGACILLLTKNIFM
jgi:plasmid stabilization system protein ParE